MGFKEMLFPTFQTDLHKAFTTFCHDIEEGVKWLPTEHAKHKVNERRYLNQTSHCFTQLMTNYNGDAAHPPGHTIDEMVKFLFLLKYSRGLIRA